MKNPKLTKTIEKLYLADADLWDSGELGRDDAHVKVSNVKQIEIDDALGAQVCSIRIPKALHSDLALLAKNQGMSLQSLVRKILSGHIETDKP